MEKAHGVMTIICDAPIEGVVRGMDLKRVYFRNHSHRYGTSDRND